MPTLKLILSSFGILFLSLSFGQDTSKTLKPIPVFAKPDSILRIAVIKSSIPYFELSADKLNELGATNIGDALKFVPGVQIRDYGGIGGIKSITYRSLGAAHTTVQIDGNQISNVQSGVVNLSSFELFGLKSLSFSSGQATDERSSASAYVQANTIALNSILATKPKKSRLGVYTNLTTINAYENGVYYQHKLGSNFFMGGQFMIRFGNGQYKFIHPDQPQGELQTRTNTELFNYKFRFLSGYQAKKTKLIFDLSYNDVEQELPGAAVLYNPSNDQKLWNRNWRLNLIHTYKKEKWKLNTHANYQSAFTHYFDPYYLNLQGFIIASYIQNNHTIGLLVDRQFRFPMERVFFGSDLIYSKLNSETTLSKPTRLEQINVVGGSTVLGRFRIDANLTTQYIFDEYQLGIINTNKEFFKASPFLSVAYLPFEKINLRIRSFYKSTFRMPTFNDLYYTFIGNTNLKPEQAKLFNIGLTYGFKRKKIIAEFTADAYHNLVTDKIVAIPTKDLFNWSMQNIGKVAINGIDLAALFSFKLKKIAFTINANYNYNSSIDITNKASITYGHQIPYIPFNTFGSGFSVDWKKITFSTNVLSNGFRYTLNENIYANYLPGFTDINLGLSKKLKIKKANLLIDLKALNILNKNYQVIKSFPMPGRYFQIRLKYTLDQ